MRLPTNEQWEGWFLLGQEENSSSFSQPRMKNYLKLFSEQHITLKSCSRSARWTQELTVRMFQDLLLMLPSRAKLSCRVKIKIKRFMLSCYLIGHNWANRPYSQPLKYFPPNLHCNYCASTDNISLKGTTTRAIQYQF